MSKVHYFDDTGEAYDMCQISEEVKIGDVLVIEEERVVGVADTWPVAVTKECGHLHAFHPEANIEQWAKDFCHNLETQQAKLNGYAAAIAEAKKRGWLTRED